MTQHIVGSYLWGLTIVALALAGFYAAARVWRSSRFGSSCKKRLISVVESTVLMPQTVLQVVRIGRRYYALGGGAGRLTLLCELPESEIEADRTFRST